MAFSDFKIGVSGLCSMSGVFARVDFKRVVSEMF